MVIGAEMLRVSLIMATIGRREEIHPLLDSLERQSSLAFELIVVDQNQDELLEPILNRLSLSKMQHTYLKSHRKGLSIARNAAFPCAEFEIIGYPDDDCWYGEEVIANVIAAFANDPDMDGIIGRWSEADAGHDTEHLLKNKEWRQFRTGISGSSICIFFRREMIEKVGGFDERLGVPQWFGAGEETDLIFRCLSSGAKIRYMPNVQIHHSVNARDADMDLERVRRRSRGAGALYRKHGLSYYVIFRGLLSPLVKSFLPPYSFKRILANVTIILGRIEGLICWKNTP